MAIPKKTIQNRLSYYFRLRVNKKSFAMMLISIVCYLVWLMAFPMFGPIIASFLGGLKALAIEKGRFVQLFLISMTLSSIACGYLIDKAKRRVIVIWIAAIVASLLTFAFVWLIGISIIFIFAFILGFISGVSPPAWGAYFADHTSPEDRGRIMGISVGLSFSIAYLFLIAEPFEIGWTMESKFIIIGSCLLITLLTITLRPKEKTEEIVSKGRGGPEAKQLVFYASPMFLFYLVAGILLSIVFPTVQDHLRNELFYLIWGIPFLFGAIFAGFLLDTRGRKFPTIVGLAITGVSLAILGIIGIGSAYMSIIPLAIGFSFVTTLSFTIWADLAPAKDRGWYYGGGIGLMTSALLLGNFSAGGIFGSVSASQIGSYMLFSSVALFLCIPPLIIAEETLPKEVIEKRQLKEYLDQVKKKFVSKE